MMGTGIYLIDNPPRQRQFRPRGTTPSGVVVVHTAESAPDTKPEDLGAEAVAKFIQGRSDFGSYHTLCDSDSFIRLVRYQDQAYQDGTGSNPHAMGLSAATQAAKWPLLPDWWVDGTIELMAVAAADYAHWIKDQHGITIPARRITREQSDKRIPGFISHGERDPGRRTDPGKTFPWDQFLQEYEAEMNPDSRGPNVDKALKKARAATKAALEIKGDAQREAAAREAVTHLRAARKRLRTIPKT